MNTRRTFLATLLAALGLPKIKAVQASEPSTLAKCRAYMAAQQEDLLTSEPFIIAQKTTGCGSTELGMSLTSQERREFLALAAGDAITITKEWTYDPEAGARFKRWIEARKDEFIE